MKRLQWLLAASSVLMVTAISVLGLFVWQMDQRVDKLGRVNTLVIDNRIDVLENQVDDLSRDAVSHSTTITAAPLPAVPREMIDPVARAEARRAMNKAMEPCLIYSKFC